MKCIVIYLIAFQAIICSGIVHSSAYNPVFEYDVPVASQPIVYSAPAVQAGPYVGSYAVHTTPAVSHAYSHTQTHPIAYVKPVTVFGDNSGSYGSYGSYYSPVSATSGHYYAPAAPVSKVEQTRLIVPQTSRIYRYQTNQQYGNLQSGDSQGPNRNVQERKRPIQQYSEAGSAQYQDQYSDSQGTNRNVQERKRPIQQYSEAGSAQYQDQYNGNGQNQYDENYQGQNNRRVYAGGNPYTNNGEQMKLRRYRIHRPGIQKEFYDVEERVIVRPAGSALIELDPPTKKQEVTNYQPYGRHFGSNQGQFGQKGLRPNTSNGSTRDQNQGDQQYFITGDPNVPNYNVPDCGTGEQTPVYEYAPPATTFNNPEPPTQYHPTTFAPPSNTYPTTTSSYPTTTSSYPTTVNVPNQTYLPPVYSTDHSFSSTSTPGEYSPSTSFSSTPGQYTPTSTSTASNTKTSQQSDIYISSSTPVTVTIVDKNDNGNQSRKQYQTKDIIYAGQQRGQGQSDENSPDQFRNELPPRGDLSQYRAEQPDQFYHELPRSRYTNDPTRPPQAYNVYTRSKGEPTESPAYGAEEADVVEIEPKSNNGTNNRNQTSGNSQQARLIELYTGNGGVSEVGQTDDQTNSQRASAENRNAQYQDVGNVRARVISVTPPPATAIPTETVNRRRIVVSKPVTTVQEVVEADNSTDNSQRSNNYRNQGRTENYTSESNGNYRNGEYNANSNQIYNDDNYGRSYNGGQQSKKANYEDSTSSTASSGVFISTTPSTASQRIIYVQPVSQNFAQQKAIPPKKE